MEIKYDDLFWFHPEIFEPLLKSWESEREWVDAILKDERVQFLRHLSESGFGWSRDAKRRVKRNLEVALGRDPELPRYRRHWAARDPNKIFYTGVRDLIPESIGDIVSSIVNVNELYTRVKAIIKKDGIRAASSASHTKGIPALAVLETVDPIGKLVPLLELAMEKEGIIQVINALCDIGGYGLTWLVGGDNAAKRTAAESSTLVRLTLTSRPAKFGDPAVFYPAEDNAVTIAWVSAVVNADAKRDPACKPPTAFATFDQAIAYVDKSPDASRSDALKTDTAEIEVGTKLAAARLAAVLDRDFDRYQYRPLWGADPKKDPKNWNVAWVPNRNLVKLKELNSRRKKVLVVGPDNIFSILDFLRLNAMSPEVRARNGALSFFDWLMAELERQPHQLIQFCRQALPEAMNTFESTIIGDGEAMCVAKCQGARAAQCEYSVLLLGESGTGKEMFARAIHRSSDRRDKPFVTVNCAAISDALFASEMFGHVKGAFTGAVADYDGAFVRAHGGTILLDEIGECSLENQTKLLRAIQSSPDADPCQLRITRVGASEDIEVDVRVFSGTNAKLLEMVQKKQFRSDLYERLATIILNLPPLRKRVDPDLRQLVDYFWERINNQLSGRLGYQAKNLDESAYARLAEHSWPGNVRELTNVLKRAAVMSLGSVIVRSNIDTAIGEMPKHATDEAPREDLGPGLADASLHNINRAAIEEALKTTNWNKSAAGKLLGIDTRQTFYGMIKRFKIKRPTTTEHGRRPKPKPKPPADSSS